MRRKHREISYIVCHAFADGVPSFNA